MLGATEIVLVGKESVRGTAVAGAMHLPIIGDGFKPTMTGHVGSGVDSGSFPHPRECVSLGYSPSLALEPVFNVNTCKDIIGMALDRASKILKSFTMFGTPGASAGIKIAGSVCKSLALEFSRSDNPDVASLMTAKMEFAGMSNVDADSVAGTPAVGNRFVLHQSTFTLNSVAEAKIKSFAWNLTNELYLQEHTSSGVHAGIEDGPLTHEFSLSRRFTSLDWHTLARAQTDIAASFVLATGTANETITLTIAHAKLDMHERGGGGGIIDGSIKLRPFTIDGGTTPPVAIAYGSAIGASALSLSGTG